MRLVKTNVNDLFVLSDPTFRVNIQKWPKTLKKILLFCFNKQTIYNFIE